MTVNVKMSGPIVSGQGPRIVDAVMQRAVRDLVEKGIERLNQMLRPRPAGVYLSIGQAGTGKGSTGNYRRHVHPTFSTLHAMITDGGVVYGPWLEFGGAGTRFRGYATFRRVGQWMEKTASLILKKHANTMVKRLGKR